MKTAIAILALALLAGCTKEAESTQQQGNYVVEKLFTHENFTVYRFDDGRKVYYTDCQGKTEWRQSCGRNCSRTVGVDGGAKDPQ